MKKLTFTLLGLLVSMLTFAGHVNEQEARQRALEFLHQGPVSESRSNAKTDNYLQTAQIEQTMFYVFNVGEQDGFVIISADDQTQPVLGYSKQGTFDAETISPEMKWWLDGYETQLKAVREGKERLAEPTANHAAIAPMVSSQWNQSAPYNLLTKTSSSQYVTGCVATAMAQIMYYHKWPEQVTETLPSPDGLMLDLDPTTFNWSLMRDRYNRTDTDDGAQEVAKLMKYCGYAAKMNYGDGSSGAQSYNAVEGLRRYLGYHYTTEEVMRADYTTAEWDELIYNELANQRPVLYTGYSASGGHAFVCDGYDGNGMYHINWGWGGVSDAYFLLSLLNPDDQGIGGFPGEDGYSVWQSAIIGIQKATQAYDGIRLELDQINSNSTQASRTSNTQDFVVTANVSLSTEDESLIGNKYDVAMGLYQGNNLLQITALSSSSAEIKKRFGNIQPISFNNKQMVIPHTLADGTYQLRVLQRRSGTTEWLKTQWAECIYIRLTISGDKMTIQNVLNYTAMADNLTTLKVNSVTVNGKKRAQSPLELMLNITNTGTYNTGIVNLIYSSSPGFETKTEGITTEMVSRIGVNLDPGKTDNIPMHYTPATAGTYYFRITNMANDEVLKEFSVNVIDKAPINISAAQNKIEGAVLKVGYTNYYDYYSTTLNISYQVTNNGTDSFEDYLYAFLFSAPTDGDFGSSSTYETAYASIPVGETVTVPFTFTGLADNMNYLVNLIYIENGAYTNTGATGTQILYVVPGRTAIRGVTTDKMQSASCIFDLQGREVKTPQRGVYIINGKKVVK